MPDATERIIPRFDDDKPSKESRRRSGGRLETPMRVALFGHRNVGKTTLLAIFYRQASSGAIPGLRLAAGDCADGRVSGGEDRADRVGTADGGLAGRDGSEPEALPWLRAFRPDCQGLSGRARHPRLGGADPGILRRLRRRIPVPRPRRLVRSCRAPSASARGGKPARALHRAVRGCEDRSARRRCC